ncbi:ribbon-helix-helix domain-containing protein [Enterobacteriaceae bacterium H11S18]|uniref:ribbon-helix-helix domain-containing protein n=1 Tax=Dryocola clanedunensis TaxID=2925396 RepID=UPI0022F0D94A|nr:CopG family transcriptional regulator [Dryocola clanedunensis]MCT4706375.1 ribbon-helix-helix domain-containing protein [Dryocola clanedunensis]MCT4713128.1 ribbon-helix-helix domain-containing protein [Dryocola clanedunensis]
MMLGEKMGRILLDLSDEVVSRLDELKKRRNLPRAELLREAVDQYLERQAQTVLTHAFGLWGERKIDGLEYERLLREEWS